MTEPSGRSSQSPSAYLDRMAESALASYRTGAPASFPPPPVATITRAARRQSALRVVILVGAVLAVIGGPALLLSTNTADRATSGAPDSRSTRTLTPPGLGVPPTPGPAVSTSLPGPGGPPPGRIDVGSFRTRLPAIVEADGSTRSCPGGDAVFASDGANPATATVGRTRYVLGGHPTMPDHVMPATQVDLDDDGVPEILTTIACEPAGGRRTVNLYVLKQNGGNYDVLDVPFSDNRAFDSPRPVLFGIAASGSTLVVTVDDLPPQPEPPPSKIPDGRPDNPRGVTMNWNGSTYQPRIGDYRW